MFVLIIHFHAEIKYGNKNLNIENFWQKNLENFCLSAALDILLETVKVAYTVKVVCCSLYVPITEIAQSHTRGIFVLDMAYFIVIQWSMTLCFIGSQ